MTRLGYQIPNFTYPDTTPATLFDVIAAQAKEADRSGFDTVLVMDHFYQLPMIGPADFEMLSATRCCRRSPGRPSTSGSARSSPATRTATRRCWPRP